MTGREAVLQRGVVLEQKQQRHGRHDDHKNNAEPNQIGSLPCIVIVRRWLIHRLIAPTLTVPG